MSGRNTYDTLERLSNAIGIPGFEEEPREVLRELVAPFVDELRVDALGNLLATQRGRGDITLMLDAHMDEVGFMVSYIEPNGYLRFAPIGGWDARIIPSHQLTVVTDDGRRIKGIIGTPPPHILKPADRERPFDIDDLFVDIGAADDADARRRGIRIGSQATIAYPFERLSERVVTGKALDDRAGCAVIVETLAALAGQDVEATVVAAFTVCEETGLIGATTAAYQIEPDVALALEGTICADAPGIAAQRTVTRSGAGPAISVADRSQVVRPRVVRALTAMAEREGIPHQFKLPPLGGTDAGAIQRSRGGVLAGVVSVPCRYIHSPFAVMSLDDFDNAVRLTTAFARGCGELLAG
jgi:endoglucanase